MKKVNLLVLFVLFAIANIGYSQQLEKNIQKSTKIELIDGYKFYLHKVEKGQTLFYIAKAYDVPVQDIIADNPGSEKSISLGQELKIYVDRKIKYFSHTVKADETLWTIAKRYNSTIQNITNENPDVKKGIKEGMVLLIPTEGFDKIKTQEVIIDPKIGSEKKTENQINKKTDESIVHIVVKGETLYSISKKYNVSIDEIMKLNPIVADGLKPDQVLLIKGSIVANNADTLKPNDLSSSKTVLKAEHKQEEQFSLDADLSIYTVKKNETLYSISKQYNISTDQILFHNPEAVYGVKEGQEIQLPLKDQKKKDKKNTELIESKVDFSKSDTVQNCGNSSKKSSYIVSILVPFYLKNISEIAVPEGNEKMDPVNYKSFSFIGFYEGIMLAVDSLKKNKANLEIKFYDTDDDTNSLKKIFSKPELQKSDLIIGPFFNSSLKFAAKFAQKNKIPLLSPFAIENKVLSNNPLVYKATPSYDMQMELLAKYIVDSCKGTNIIVVNNSKSGNLSGLFTSFLKKYGNNSLIPKIIDYSKEGLNGVFNSLLLDKENVIIGLIDNQVTITNMLTGLSGKTKEYPITVFGISEWLSYNSIEVEYLEKLKFHTFSPYFIDNSKQNVCNFISAYNNKFNSIPDRYAFAGYDLIMCFSEALMNYGINFGSCVSKVSYQPMHTKYNFVSNGKDGFENKYISIYKIKDYQLIQVR
ncbi:MAG: LysM peptidoglycan-binding domain-containing protein [Bacteroidota bacterium]